MAYSNSDGDVFRLQLTKATLNKRDYTGAGFFINLAVALEVPKILAERDDINPYPGPFIEIPELDGDGDAILYINDGLIDTLAIFAYGDTFPEKLVAVYPHKATRNEKFI